MDVTPNIKILATYDCVFDLDYGMLKTIVLDYNNPVYLNDDYLRKVSFEQLTKDLCNQEVRDPLKLAFKDGIDYSYIYNELKNNKQKEITENACPTNILAIFNLYIRDDLADIYIICKNKYEEEIVKKHKYHVVRDDDINIENYDSLYVKDHMDIINNFKDIKHKNIYIANCSYNYYAIEKDLVPLNEEIGLLGLENEINIYKLY